MKWSFMLHSVYDEEGSLVLYFHVSDFITKPVSSLFALQSSQKVNFVKRDEKHWTNLACLFSVHCNFKPCPKSWERRAWQGDARNNAWQGVTWNNSSGRKDQVLWISETLNFHHISPSSTIIYHWSILMLRDESWWSGFIPEGSELTNGGWKDPSTERDQMRANQLQILQQKR